MYDPVAQRARCRALLTDTLPYEVPVIFSNDRLYAALVRDERKSDRRTNEIVYRIHKCAEDVTQPYRYCIAKDGRRFTNLGIIHPTTQTLIASFYQSFSSSLLSSCSNGDFSLRRPIGETPLFSEAELDGLTTFKLGIPHVDPNDGEIDLSHVVSYFSYGKYNLLGKFVESEEFRRLEKRFRHLQTLDVSRCFASIYTHSVAWAVKGRDVAKTNRNAFSFEGKLDAIMQGANYGETNGIVIGPEFARIFAEIILQDIDRKIAKRLEPSVNNRDFAIRRYVDDYFIFCNSLDQITLIADVIAVELEGYKLFINNYKGKAATRPFVSAISLARAEIADTINDIYELADSIAAASDAGIMASKARALRTKADAIRQACSKHDIELHVVSGWVLTNLRNVLFKLVRHACNSAPSLSSSLYLCISAVLDITFYVCAVDMRVRTTYALCQSLAVLKPLKSLHLNDLTDRVMHFVSEEMAVLIRNALALGDELSVGVEMCNLLISGYHYLGPSFLKSDAAKKALRHMVDAPGFSYFRYITVKFCCHREPDQSDLLKEINIKAIERLGDGLSLLKRDAEVYLIFCDLLSAPDLTPKEKRILFRERFGGNPPKNSFDPAADMIGFVDWTGVAIEHTLQRKALRPVYTWS